MKTCILLGDRSDIAQGLLPYLKSDGWEVYGWRRYRSLPDVAWDLLLCTMGAVAPVGPWAAQTRKEVEACVTSNLLMPLDLLKCVWDQRNDNATVCFMGGSNPQKIMPGYLPYHMSKMALLKAIEQIDTESPNCKIFALGPGYVKTKIHKATLKAKWPNERIARGDDGTPIEKIWKCLQWCIAQPKDVVGGRNICTSDPWDKNEVSTFLSTHHNFWKLRRVE